jgi:hypothetical protein
MDNNEDEKSKIDKMIKEGNAFKLLSAICVAVIIIGMIGLYLYNEANSTIVKPIIYLYPEEDTNISVVLEKPDNITCSYPKYTTGWNVFAKTNGDLIDLDTGRNLYSLYYESDKDVEHKMTDEGFVIKGQDSAIFLEEKLEVLGLNEREAEEFIVYWLPILEKNKYNYIRFASAEEIDLNMPIRVNPVPDTVIRVLMITKPLDKYEKVNEQQLEKVERNGYTLVEWGGTIID